MRILFHNDWQRQDKNLEAQRAEIYSQRPALCQELWHVEFFRLVKLDQLSFVIRGVNSGMMHVFLRLIYSFALIVAS
jgi:hypothetical protein